MPDAEFDPLETFPNPSPERDYTIHMNLPEFTCLCPRTGQPDFANLDIEYIPDKLCVELKSLKLYIWNFRDRGAFHEAVTHAVRCPHAQIHAHHGQIQRPRRHLHHSRCGTPHGRMEMSRPRHPALTGGLRMYNVL